MKKLMVALLMLVAFTSVAGAMSWIGMFAFETAEEICYADIAPGPPVPVYFIAVIGEGEFENGITAVEFSVDNLPPNDMVNGMINPVWTSEVTVGTLDWDQSVAWTAPQMGPFVLIGTVYFAMYTPSWIGLDHVMTIVEGHNCECLVMTDHEFNIVDVLGGMFTWNCTTECFCFDDTATQESSWGAVKALF